MGDFRMIMKTMFGILQTVEQNGKLSRLSYQDVVLFRKLVCAPRSDGT